MKFLDKYDQYKKDFLICEGTVKGLIPLIQQNLLSIYNVDSYQDLTDEQKKDIQKLIDNNVEYYKKRMDEVTDNKQYQSWLYDFLISIQKGKIDQNDWDYFKRILTKFSKIVKSPLITQEQRNINNYKTIADLSQFVHDFEDSHPDYKKPDFKLVLSTEHYSIYQIDREQRELFQDMYGANGFKCAWCVADHDRTYFETYLNEGLNDCYYLWTYKGSYKPYALLEFNSEQFKDIHNEQMVEYSDEIMSALMKLAKIAEYDWSLCGDNDSDLSAYKWLGIYRTNQLGEPIAVDNDLKLYKDENNLINNELNEDVYILANGDEDVVGYFTLQGNIAHGLMSSSDSLKRILGLNPDCIIKVCRDQNIVFNNISILAYLLTHQIPLIVKYMTQPNIELLGTVFGNYEIYGIRNDNDIFQTKYFVYNKEDKFYELKITIEMLHFLNKTTCNVFVVEPVFKKHSEDRKVPDDIIEQILESIKKINKNLIDVEHLILRT